MCVMGITPLSALGMAVSAGSSMMQASSQQSAMKYNAAVSRMQAEEQRRVTMLEESRVRSAGRRAQSGMIASVGGAGVDLGTGSPLALAFDSAADAEMDALTSRAGGNMKSASFDRQGALYDAKASSIMPIAMFGAGTKLLTSVRQWGALN